MLNTAQHWDFRKDFHRAEYIVQLLDTLEADHAIREEGGFLIDWHACDMFPESWIDLVVVLRTDSTVLYDRLRARGYCEKKLQENLDSEIMGLLCD